MSKANYNGKSEDDAIFWWIYIASLPLLLCGMTTYTIASAWA